MPKRRFASLQPGDVLGDYHDVGASRSLLELVQSRTEEPIQMSETVFLDGEYYQWIDKILQDQLGAEARPYTNKHVVVLQYCRAQDMAYTIAWSWDGLWMGLRTLSLKE